MFGLRRKQRTASPFMLATAVPDEGDRSLFASRGWYTSDRPVSLPGDPLAVPWDPPPASAASAALALPQASLLAYGAPPADPAGAPGSRAGGPQSSSDSGPSGQRHQRQLSNDSSATPGAGQSPASPGAFSDEGGTTETSQGASPAALGTSDAAGQSPASPLLLETAAIHAAAGEVVSRGAPEREREQQQQPAESVGDVLRDAAEKAKRGEEESERLEEIRKRICARRIVRVYVVYRQLRAAEQLRRRACGRKISRAYAQYRQRRDLCVAAQHCQGLLRVRKKAGAVWALVAPAQQCQSLVRCRALAGAHRAPKTPRLPAEDAELPVPACAAAPDVTDAAAAACADARPAEEQRAKPRAFERRQPPSVIEQRRLRRLDSAAVPSADALRRAGPAPAREPPRTVDEAAAQVPSGETGDRGAVEVEDLLEDDIAALRGLLVQMPPPLSSTEQQEEPLEAGGHAVVGVALESLPRQMNLSFWKTLETQRGRDSVMLARPPVVAVSFQETAQERVATVADAALRVMEQQQHKSCAAKKRPQRAAAAAAGRGTAAQAHASRARAKAAQRATEHEETPGARLRAAVEAKVIPQLHRTAAATRRGMADAVPTELFPCSPVSFDLGGSVVKVVFWERESPPVLPPFMKLETPPEGLPLLPPRIKMSLRLKAPNLTGVLRFAKFEEDAIPQFLSFVRQYGLAELYLGQSMSVPATGGGAFKYADLVRERTGMKLALREELPACVRGLVFLLEHSDHEIFTYESRTFRFYSTPTWKAEKKGMFPFELVTVGSGVSMYKVTSPDSFERVSGTALGGGSFWGLCKLLTQVGSYAQVKDLWRDGDSKKADLLVGDIYGGDYGAIGLSADTTASFFGKLQRSKNPRADVSTADVAKSLTQMVTMNVAQIAFLNARLHGLHTIFFSGSFLRDHPLIWERLTESIKFWSKGEIKAMFLLHDGYLGALGALLEPQPATPELRGRAPSHPPPPSELSHCAAP
eukprot:m51a1_g3077 putative pantothenate kinase (984) ;mRNA; r:45561-49998